MNTSPNQESVDAPKFLDRLSKLAEEAGGDAPLPKPPATTHLSDLANRVGNDQLKAIHEQKARLEKEIADWQKQAESIVQRQPRWKQLTALLDHAADLPVAAEVQPEATAIEQNRSLLSNPDPVPGLVEKLAAALRDAINQAHAACVASHEDGLSSLDASPTWQKLTPDQRYELLSAFNVRQVPAIAVGTTEEILNTLRQTKLSELRALSDALAHPLRQGPECRGEAVGAEGPARHVAGRHHQE